MKLTTVSGGEHISKHLLAIRVPSSTRSVNMLHHSDVRQLSGGVTMNPLCKTATIAICGSGTYRALWRRFFQAENVRNLSNSALLKILASSLHEADTPGLHHQKGRRAKVQTGYIVAGVRIIPTARLPPLILEQSKTRRVCPRRGLNDKTLGTCPPQFSNIITQTRIQQLACATRQQRETL